MTIRELILQLTKFPQDAHIRVIDIKLDEYNIRDIFIENDYGQSEVFIEITED